MHMLILTSLDTLQTYFLEEVQVIVRKLPLSQSSNMMEIERNYDKLGNFAFIKKGAFSPDVYLNGFKKADISIILEGERQLNACPNRMDAGILRYYSLHYSKLYAITTSSELQSGIGGSILIERNPPTTKLSYGFLNEARSNGLGMQASATLSMNRQRISFTYILEKDYTFGRNMGSFLDTYNYYKDTTIYVFGKTFRIGDELVRYVSLAYSGDFNNFKLNVDFFKGGPILFPYLMMDEINTNSINVSLENKNLGKIYASYTDHPMSNVLRKNQMAYMENQARNYVFGYVNSFMEVLYRSWHSRLYMKSYMTGMESYQNVMDNYQQFKAIAKYSKNYGSTNLSAKLGLNLEQAKYLGYPVKRLDPILAINISRYIDAVRGSAFMELAVQEPYPIYRYFTFQSMKMNNVIKQRLGDTTLLPVKKLSVGVFNKFMDLQLNFVKDYAYLKGYTRNEGGITYLVQTYENVDAFILSVSARYEFGKYLSIGASYSYGWNMTYRRPLPEILPLRLKLDLRTPSYRGFALEIANLYTFPKDSSSIDPSLEIITPSYYKLDARLTYKPEDRPFYIALGVDNLLDEYYYEPLSYMRNPFSTGTVVYERGRSFYVRFYIGR